MVPSTDRKGTWVSMSTSTVSQGLSFSVPFRKEEHRPGPRGLQGHPSMSPELLDFKKGQHMSSWTDEEAL